MIPLSIIIPAYNEEESMKETLNELLPFCNSELREYQIIVVDDASTDRTPTIAKGYKEVTVIRNPVNIGYGGSIKRALSEARYEHVLIMDADGTYPAGEIKKLLPFAGDFDMVVGARQGKYFHGSLFKRLSRLVFYILLKYVTGEHIPDANSGLRIFRKSAVTKFKEDLCNGFSFTTTITIILLSNRYLIKFVPIEYNKRIGKSKVRYVRDAARTFQMLVENITYYNPIKAFLPFSIVAFSLFLLFTGLYIFKTGTLFHGLSAVVSFFSSMLFFGLGLVCFVIVKRKRQ